MQVKRIRRNSAASIVRHELKKMIKSGYFKDGAIPSEEGIAAMLCLQGSVQFPFVDCQRKGFCR